MWQPVEPETYLSPYSASPARPETVFATPGYTQPKPAKNPLATTSIVLGIIGVLFPVLSLGAVVRGHIAIRDRSRTGLHTAPGRLGPGYASLAMWGPFILPAIASAHAYGVTQP